MLDFVNVLIRVLSGPTYQDKSLILNRCARILTPEIKQICSAAEETSAWSFRIHIDPAPERLEELIGRRLNWPRVKIGNCISCRQQFSKALFKCFRYCNY